MGTLPAELQAVCRSRMERNRRQTEGQLRISRREFEAAMVQIREHFARAGFAKS